MLNNMTFNGIKHPYIIVVRRDKPYWAPLRRNFTTVPGLPGARLSRKKTVEPRPIPVDIWIEAGNIDDLQNKAEAIAGWLDQDEPAPLIFDDEPNRTYFAVVDGELNPDEIANHSFLSISFICPDPYKYGPEKQQQLAHPTLSSNPIVNNQGTVAVAHSMDITLKATSPDLLITNGDKELRIIWDFSAGETVKIDFKKRTIIINGHLQMTALDLQKADFFKLQPGANTFTISPSTDTLITYREGWK